MASTGEICKPRPLWARFDHYWWPDYDYWWMDKRWKVPDILIISRYLSVNLVQEQRSGNLITMATTKLLSRPFPVGALLLVFRSTPFTLISAKSNK